MRRLIVPLILILLAPFLVGCSDGDSSTSDSSTRATTDGASSNGGQEAAPEADTAYCQEILAIQGVGAATNEQAVELVREVQAVAPQEHQADLEVLMGAMQKLAEANPLGTPGIESDLLTPEEQQEVAEAVGRLTDADRNRWAP